MDARPSKHHSPRGAIAPYLIVVHSTRSGRASFTDADEYAATLRWFENNPVEVSAHYVVNAKAEVTPCVPLDKSAHHAGGHNQYSFGIELTQPIASRPYEDGHYAGLRLCYQLINKWQRAQGWREIPPIRVMTAFGSAGLIGHSDSEQGRSVGKSDPGYMFDWDKLIAMLE